MTGYIVRRLLLFIPTLFLVTAVTFIALRAIPGNAIDIFLGEGGRLTPAQQSELEKEMGLDKTLPEQYVIWLGDLAQGDLGESFLSGRSVGTLLQGRAEVTIELGVLSILFGLLIGLPTGVIAAFRAGSWLDQGLRTLAVLGLSVPSYWIGTLVILLPAIWWGWSPPRGNISIFDSFGDNMQQFLLPAIVLGLSIQGSLTRVTRTAVLEIIREDYVRTARAKGLGTYAVSVQHTLRNALLPIVTLLGAQIRFVLGGTIIVEAVFGLTGIGSLMYTGILNRDYPVVQSVAFVLATVVLVVNLLVDLSYAYLDPRVKYS